MFTPACCEPTEWRRDRDGGYGIDNGYDDGDDDGDGDGDDVDVDGDGGGGVDDDDDDDVVVVVTVETHPGVRLVDDMQAVRTLSNGLNL